MHIIITWEATKINTKLKQKKQKRQQNTRKHFLINLKCRQKEGKKGERIARKNKLIDFYHINKFILSIKIIPYPVKLDKNFRSTTL